MPGPTGGGSIEPLPQGARQIKKEQQELQQLQQQQQCKKPGVAVPVTQLRKRTATGAEVLILQPADSETGQQYRVPIPNIKYE